MGSRVRRRHGEPAGHGRRTAQEQLGDVVYIGVPDVGVTVNGGEEAGVAESVKSASDVFSPVTGEVIEVNESLEDEPEKVNEDPYGDGWLYKVKLADAENLASRGELTPALRLLQRVSKISTAAVTQQRAQQLGNQIKFKAAEKTFANAMACESPERRKIHQANALRKFSTLSRTAQDEDLRQRADDYIAQLRGSSQAESKNTLLAATSDSP